MDENELIKMFLTKLKKGLIKDETRKRLYKLVINLNKRTEKQKERFILLYNLKPNQKEKYNGTSLANEQGCTLSAIKYSVIRVKSNLVNLKGEEKRIFLDIIKNDNK